MYKFLPRPEHGHSIHAAIVFQDSGPSFQIGFYISLGRATVPVRINVMDHFGDLVSVFLSVSLFSFYFSFFGGLSVPCLIS